MNTNCLILLCLTIALFVILIITALITHQGEWAILCLFGLLTSTLFSLNYWAEPTNNDIRDGKAIIIEENHIGVSQEGDTTFNYRTYHIEWLPEWKYGRYHDPQD